MASASGCPASRSGEDPPVHVLRADEVVVGGGEGCADHIAVGRVGDARRRAGDNRGAEAGRAIHTRLRQDLASTPSALPALHVVEEALQADPIWAFTMAETRTSSATNRVLFMIDRLLSYVALRYGRSPIAA